MSLYLKSFPGEYNVFLGQFSALTPFAKLSSQNNASLLFPQMIWFPKGGVEEEKGENVFSFLMNVKLTEPKVKLIGLTLVFSVEGDTWCLCSLSKHAYPLFYSARIPLKSIPPRLSFRGRYYIPEALTSVQEFIRGQ